MNVEARWPVIAGVGSVDVKARFTATEYIRLGLEVERAVRRARDEYGAAVGVCSMAPGFDTIFAHAVLGAGMKLWAYRTGPWQAERWTPAQRREWEVLCGQAARVEDISPAPSEAAARQCNRAMVDVADAAITCWYPDEFAGETYQTLLYAIRHGRPAVHVDPTVGRDEEALRLPSEAFWRRKLRIEQRTAALLAA